MLGKPLKTLIHEFKELEDPSLKSKVMTLQS